MILEIHNKKLELEREKRNCNNFLKTVEENLAGRCYKSGNSLIFFGLRISGPSDQLAFGLSGLRTIGPSD